MDIFKQFQQRYSEKTQEVMSLEDYLKLCKKDPDAYASSSQRMLRAIGEPELIDTSKDPRLSRIFSNKIIKRYPAFK